MNYVSDAKIINLVNGQEFNLCPKDIRVNDDLSFTCTPFSEAYNLEDSVYYTKSDLMNEIKFSLYIRIDVEKDTIFKNFINSPENDFVLEITINHKKYKMYVEIGQQTADINQKYLKGYEVELKLKAKPFLTEVYKDAKEEEYYGGAYDDEQGYDIIEYSVDDGNYLESAFNVYVNNKGHGNMYFEISGVGNGEDISIKVDGKVIKINNIGKYNNFFYSNIPNNLTLKVNGDKKIELLDLSNATNFKFDLNKQKANFIIEGLDDILLTIYSVVNML